MMQLDIYLSPLADHLRISYLIQDVEHPDDLYLVDTTLQALALKQFDVSVPSILDTLQSHQHSEGQLGIVVFSNGRLELTVNPNLRRDA